MQTHTERSLSDVAVVILNYNGEAFLKTFLPSVVRYSRDARVVVADNASTDGSVLYVKSHFPHVTLLTFDRNHGFCGGYNRAMEEVAEPFCVLLNSDVEVTEGWLDPLVHLMRTMPEVAACQPKILSWHQRTHFEYAGAAGGMIDVLGYPFSRGRLFDTLEEDTGQYQDISQIFWATGACMMIRAGLFRKYGGFEESFFAHMEEIDLCWRLKNDGYTILYHGGSAVYHVGGGTLPKTNPAKTFLNFRNSLLMLARNLPARLMFPVIFGRLVLDGLAGINFLLKGEGGNVWAIIRAHFSFYAHLPGVLGKKRKKNRMFTEFASVYGSSVVWSYFFRKERTYQQLNWPDRPASELLSDKPSLPDIAADIHPKGQDEV